MADEEITDNPETPATGDEPEPTPQPADLGDAGKKALAEERQGRREEARLRREAEARLKELEPLAAEAEKAREARKSAEEKLNEKLTAAERRAVDAEQRLLRSEVAAEKGLTAAQARRLVGATREELEADADDLLTVFGPSGTPEPDAAADRDPAPDGEPAAQRTPPERLRPGGLPTPKPPTLPEQIAAAEKANDWGTARRLKTQQLVEMTQQT
ncbi:hypothetical protein [Streptomyces phytophilus]|uniref:hypothetical protein n=1 Tax=Streptomyces phytophilus TaxID=722715 RepID=UPI0015F10D3D|nr:hypothetical protein [Streptomyces phytophilus]